jgi:Zn-dependent peptidase ImmA (M78 family)
MAGVADAVISSQETGAKISFALDDRDTSRVVLRPKWETGRRFELARLLGDGVAAPNDNKLKAATRAYTYRQKMQRSFAAELLSPFEAVTDMLHRDFSDESLESAARHFAVSERAVRTLLVNHGCLDREDLAEDFEGAAAA